MSRPPGSIRGAAAAEMALVAPVLLILLYGSVETGRYFYDQHILTKAVRDGAIYASRQAIDNFDCTTSPASINSTVVSNTQAVVKSGALSGSANLLNQWGATGASFAMTLKCVTAAGGTTLGGIYTANGGNVPVLTITTSVPYTPVTGGYIFNWAGFTLHASQQAAVIAA